MADGHIALEGNAESGPGAGRANPMGGAMADEDKTTQAATLAASGSEGTSLVPSTPDAQQNRRLGADETHGEEVLDEGVLGTPKAVASGTARPTATDSLAAAFLRRITAQAATTNERTIILGLPWWMRAEREDEQQTRLSFVTAFAAWGRSDRASRRVLSEGHIRRHDCSRGRCRQCLFPYG